MTKPCCVTNEPADIYLLLTLFPVAKIDPLALLAPAAMPFMFSVCCFPIWISTGFCIANSESSSRSVSSPTAASSCRPTRSSSPPAGRSHSPAGPSISPSPRTARCSSSRKPQPGVHRPGDGQGQADTGPRRSRQGRSPVSASSACWSQAAVSTPATPRDTCASSERKTDGKYSFAEQHIDMMKPHVGGLAHPAGMALLSDERDDG